MAFDFAQTKKRARRVVHRTLGVSALYKADPAATPVPLKVRYHTKLNLTGDLTYANYVEILEGIDRIIFNLTPIEEEALLLSGQSIQANGVVELVDYEGMAFTLANQQPDDGTGEISWFVSRVL